MRAGFSEADITPEIGMERPGTYHKMFHKAFRDPLKVRCSVWENDGVKVALIGIDSIMAPRFFVKECRKQIAAHTGIPETNIMIGASHTHVGGPLWGFEPESFADAPQLIQDLALKESSSCDIKYVETATARTVSAAIEAHAGLEPVKVSVGSGKAENVAFSRRFKMRGGGTATHPGKGNPDILEPEASGDPEVGLVTAWKENGELAGCIVNFSCHCTTYGEGISADWVAWMEASIQRSMDSTAPVVFLQGACGDITQINNLVPGEQESGEKYSRRVGVTVGAEVLKMLVSAEPGDASPLAVAGKILSIPRRKPSRASIAEAEKIIGDEEFKNQQKIKWTSAKERLVLDYICRKEPEAEIEIQAVQIGPAVFLSNPAEYFSSSGIEIKQGSPFPYTFVVELANGCCGYVPSEAAFGPDGGGYETMLTSISNLAVSADTEIKTACIELAKAMQPGKISLDAPSEPVTKRWGLGKFKPELE